MAKHTEKAPLHEKNSKKKIKRWMNLKSRGSYLMMC